MMISKEIKELRGYEKRGGEFHIFFIFTDGTHTEVKPQDVAEDLNEFYKVKTQKTGQLFEGGERVK